MASVKAPELADAGKVYICLDLDDAADDYEDQKLAACTIIRDSVVAGVVSQGTETETLALSNDQSFDFSFYLPTRIPIEYQSPIDVE